MIRTEHIRQCRTKRYMGGERGGERGRERGGGREEERKQFKKKYKVKKEKNFTALFKDFKIF